LTENSNGGGSLPSTPSTYLLRDDSVNEQQSTEPSNKDLVPLIEFDDTENEEAGDISVVGRALRSTRSYVIDDDDNDGNDGNDDDDDYDGAAYAAEEPSLPSRHRQYGLQANSSPLEGLMILARQSLSRQESKPFISAFSLVEV
jgi:hypothetical protein